MVRGKKIVLVGAGGHAKVVADLLAAAGGFDLVGATDADPEHARDSGLKILGGDEILPALLAGGVSSAAVGVGAIRDTAPRANIRRRLRGLGFELPPLVHPSAVVAPSVRLGAGCQVMAGAIMNADVVLEEGCVVNTGAILEHDCRLGPDAFIGPGARLGGGVAVESGAFVGMSATVLQGVRIGANAVVGAGAVVLKDVPAGRTVVGVPAKEKRAPRRAAVNP